MLITDDLKGFTRDSEMIRRTTVEFDQSMGLEQRGREINESSEFSLARNLRLDRSELLSLVD